MDDSPLGRLAPELRNRIYDFALTSDEPYIIDADRIPLRQYTAPKQLNPLGLTSTCKAVYAESIQLFYASNAFVFRQRACHVPDFLTDFCNTIGKTNTAALKSVIMDAGRFTRWDISRLTDSIFLASNASQTYPGCCIRVECEAPFDGEPYSCDEPGMANLVFGAADFPSSIAEARATIGQRVMGTGNQKSIRFGLEVLEKLVKQRLQAASVRDQD